MFRRCWLFCAETYYPEGGFEDYVGSFDTTGAAAIACKKYVEKYGYYSGFWQIVDTQTRIMIRGRITYNNEDGVTMKELGQIEIKDKTFSTALTVRPVLTPAHAVTLSITSTSIQTVPRSVRKVLLKLADQRFTKSSNA